MTLPTTDRATRVLLAIITMCCGHCVVTRDPLYNYLENLRLLKNSEELNFLVTLTIGLGWLTLVLDIIIASCKSIDWRSYNWGPLTPAIEWFVDPVDDNLDFFGRSVFLEGWKYLCCFR